ncbi:hypothetical protein [Bradyrhizobium ottawaense]|uniref:Uncharacterized protein n=1 Tax=Bradyrhizobium ottawaense TaxID=931866 RepID=A0ABV4G4G2_9BRAD
MKTQRVLDAPGESQESFAALAAAVHPAWHQAIIRLANSTERVAFRMELLMATPIDRGFARHARDLIRDLTDWLDQIDAYASTELEDDISADQEDDDSDEDGDPAENDLEDEPSLGSLGTSEWSDQTKWAAGNRSDLEDEHDGREPDESGIGDMEGLLEQVGSQSWQLDGYV